MKPTDIIAIIVIVLVIGSAAAYIMRSKKRGIRCIGCPESSSCKAESGCKSCCNDCRSCNGEKDKKQ